MGCPRTRGTSYNHFKGTTSFPFPFFPPSFSLPFPSLLPFLFLSNVPLSLQFPSPFHLFFSPLLPRSLKAARESQGALWASPAGLGGARTPNSFSYVLASKKSFVWLVCGIRSGKFWEGIWLVSVRCQNLERTNPLVVQGFRRLRGTAAPW